jgi:hypothetical protein
LPKDIETKEAVRDLGVGKDNPEASEPPSSTLSKNAGAVNTDQLNVESPRLSSRRLQDKKSLVSLSKYPSLLHLFLSKLWVDSIFERDSSTT